MTTIKIKSNPYEKMIQYLCYDEQSGEWEDIQKNSPNSKLREDESEKSFLPFKIKEIIDIIINEYYVGKEKINVIFEGTLEEYEETQKICSEDVIAEKINLSRACIILENAKLILGDAKEIFNTVKPVIEKVINNDSGIRKDLFKVSDALDDIIPICVFGNYSAGKSTFINSLIGHEILPSGGDPVTAKIYKISVSKLDDVARIKFKHWGDPVELLFEGTNFRILKGKDDDEMLHLLKGVIEENSKAGMFLLINKALEFINGFEKEDMETIEISDVIEVETPFVKEGVLGRSRNNFVIFDTPGSNSNSNTDHSMVLAEALQGFSNGIPVWVSQYESIDSNDNAKLCDDVLNIKALDKRFTMIVLNKADCSDLPEEGFSEKQIKNILEFNSVEKMFAGGIYFVSSVMGLGAKNNGELTDKHYRRIYRSQEEMFADPEDVDYETLYIYNIMPEQIKKEVIEYSKMCSQSDEDRVYANSGLYCIEQEMEDFASKHSAYNKCQMVYIFLNDVVDKTSARIDARMETLKGTRETRRNELETAKTELIDTVTATADKKDDEFLKESKVFCKTYASSSLDYSYKHEELQELDEKIAQQNEEENQYSSQEKEYAEAKSSMWSHLKANSQSLLKGNIKESLKAIKTDFINDYKEIQENKEEMDTSRTEIDRATSDEIMQIVVDKYRDSILDAKEKASAVFKQHWMDNAEKLKNILVAIITGTDALTEEQREEISSIIVNHTALEIDDEANTVFIKAKYLKGQFLGLKFGDSERLNTKRLANNYNNAVEKTIKNMTEDLNENCYNAYKSWEANLCSVIEENITELNPQLRVMAEMIKEETEKINELENNKKIIADSLEAIKELMAWKELN